MRRERRLVRLDEGGLRRVVRQLIREMAEEEHDVRGSIAADALRDYGDQREGFDEETYAMWFDQWWSSGDMSSTDKAAYNAAHDEGPGGGAYGTLYDGFCSWLEDSSLVG